MAVAKKTAKITKTNKPARVTRIKRVEQNGDDIRQQMIAEAAYFKAERRNFSAGDTIQDWLEAEQEIDSLFRKTG